MRVVGYIDDIIKNLEDLKRQFLKEEDDVEYKNWIEGILMAAIAVLRVAR